MSQTLDSKGLYQAFLSKDTRFDGRFFAGISSTGIYCRPVCHAKPAKEENCNFFASAAEAEQAGYRPCLKCRPELAPARSLVDAKTLLASQAAKLLEENCASDEGVDILTGKLGYTDRHIRRVFAEEYHVSPVQYLQTCRLLMAKSLLTDTDLSVLDVAMTSGFKSLRRFNDAFKKHYRLSPTALRKQTTREKRADGSITLMLGYRPPYLWEELLGFLSFRAITGVEMVQDDAYLRTVQLESPEGSLAQGWIRVENKPEKNCVSLTASTSLLKVLHQVIARVKHLFDLTSSPDIIAKQLDEMNSIKPGLFVPGIRVPGCFDSFEMSVRAVLGQQITVKAAGTLAHRLTQTFGTPVDSGIEGLTNIFPTPETFLALPGEIENHLGPLGVTGARARTIRSLAQVHADHSVEFGNCATPESEIKKLVALPGIGNWTARYIALRAMGWPDAFLETDFGVKKALAPLSPKEILTMAEKWRPWRSYATVSLWNSLSAQVD